MILIVHLIAASLYLVAPAPGADNWPNWRGPSQNGLSLAKSLPLNWNESKNVLWRTELPAWAGSSPIIWADRVFLTTPSSDEDRKQSADVGRALPFITVEGGPGGKSLLLLCISKTDGRILWKKKLDDRNKLFGKQNMASPSPVTDGNWVFALLGTGRLAAIDFTGEIKWSVDLQEEHGPFALYWGYASSPCLYNDTIIVQVLHGATGGGPSYIAAYEKATGKLRWKFERRTDARRECPDAYTTPIIIKAAGREELIVSGADYVTAHDPRTGEELWRAAGLNPEHEGNYRICGTPVYSSPAKLLIATSRNKPVLALKPGGHGDVTESALAWTFDGRKGPDVPSAVCDDSGRLYLLHDDGILSCLSAKTGETLWGPKRIENGPYSASPIVAAGRVYCTNEDGTTTVVRAADKFKILAKNRLDGSYTLSSPAVSGDSLYIRTGKFLYRIGEK